MAQEPGGPGESAKVDWSYCTLDKEKLQISQYIDKHPVLREKELYKVKYIRLIEYFVKRHSGNDEWANAVLDLYKRKLLDKSNEYSYIDDDLGNMLKGVLVVFCRTGMRRYRLNRQRTKLSLKSFRYSLFIDILFICAFNNREKASIIFKDIKSIYGKTYCHKLDKLFDCLYGDNVPAAKAYDYIGYMYSCWEKNKEFINQRGHTVLVVGNMSSGKSTLINALIGKKINMMQNQACTAKVHHLCNKSFEDGLGYKLDYELELETNNKNFLKYNKNNPSSEVHIGTRFRTINNGFGRICFVDTPGANFYYNEKCSKLSNNAIQSMNYDMLIVVLNSELMQTDDDRKLLTFIRDHYNKKAIYFVVNKADIFNIKQDSVVEIIKNLKKDLTDIGFKNPLICPVSAYAGYLAKMDMYGENLEEEEMDFLKLMYKKLSQNSYKLDIFFPDKIKRLLRDIPEDQNIQLLLHSGILPLEYLLK